MTTSKTETLKQLKYLLTTYGPVAFDPVFNEPIKAAIALLEQPEADTKAEAVDPDAPKVTGAPEEIWLVYGELERDCTHEEAHMQGDGVYWSPDSIDESDIRYVRADLSSRASPSQPAEVRIGNYGAAYDGPKVCRAYTYKHQPGNQGAYRLGEVAVKARTILGGDNIDNGLSLLELLEDAGFGVFDLKAVSHAPAPQPAERADLAELLKEVEAASTLMKALATLEQSARDEDEPTIARNLHAALRTIELFCNAIPGLIAEIEYLNTLNSNQSGTIERLQSEVDQMSPPSPDQPRAPFEKWYAETFIVRVPDFTIGRGYEDPEVYVAYESWNAAIEWDRQQRAPQPETELAAFASDFAAKQRQLDSRVSQIIIDNMESYYETGASQEPGSGAVKVDDLAALVARLAHSLKNVKKDHRLADSALAYLKRHGLEGSPLRTNQPQPPALSAKGGCADLNCIDGYVPSPPDGEPEPCRACHAAAEVKP